MKFATTLALLSVIIVLSVSGCDVGSTTTQLTFEVESGGEPVQGATVSVDGHGQITTDEDGTATFNVPRGNEYTYEVTHQDYNNFEDSVYAGILTFVTHSVTLEARTITEPPTQPPTQPPTGTTQVTLTISVTGQGEVYVNDGTIATTSHTETYEGESGTEVTLTATAAGGWEFDAWSYEGCQEPTCELTLEEDLEITVTFSEEQDATCTTNTECDQGQECVDGVCIQETAPTPQTGEVEFTVRNDMNGRGLPGARVKLWSNIVDEITCIEHTGGRYRCRDVPVGSYYYWIIRDDFIEAGGETTIESSHTISNNEIIVRLTPSQSTVS